VSTENQIWPKTAGISNPAHTLGPETAGKFNLAHTDGPETAAISNLAAHCESEHIKLCYDLLSQPWPRLPRPLLSFLRNKAA
jgi:hypothetical protein